MSSNPRKHGYGSSILVTLLLLAMALWDVARKNTSDVRFDLSMACFWALTTCLKYYIERYNERHPDTPIRFWQLCMCGAALAFAIAAFNVYAATNWFDNFREFLWLFMSACLAGSAIYYYIKEPLRVLAPYFDRKE